METLMVEDTKDLQRRIDLACTLGHKETLLVFLKHEERNKEFRVPGVKLGLLVKNANQAQANAKKYDAIVAGCKREFFESKAVTHILNPEVQGRPDFVHHRNSGLNQVLLNLCKRSGKEIITSCNLLFGKRPHIILGRMMQNERFCRKYKVQYHVTSGAHTLWEQRSSEDLKALKRELGRQ